MLTCTVDHLVVLFTTSKQALREIIIMQQLVDASTSLRHSNIGVLQEVVVDPESLSDLDKGGGVSMVTTRPPPPPSVYCFHYCCCHYYIVIFLKHNPLESHSAYFIHVSC